MFGLSVVRTAKVKPNPSSREDVINLSCNTIYLPLVDITNIEKKVNDVTSRLPVRSISVRYVKDNKFNIFIDHIFRLDEKQLSKELLYTLSMKVIMSNSMKGVVTLANTFREQVLGDGVDFFMIPDPYGESVREFKEDRGIDKTPYVALVTYREPLKK